MITDYERTLFSQATIKWGVDAQATKCIQELSELIKELTKLHEVNFRYTTESIQPLIKEIVDTRLMIDQVAYTFDIDGRGLRRLMIKKLADLLERG